MSIDTRALFQLLADSPTSLREAAVLLAGSPPTNDGGALAACLVFCADMIDDDETLETVNLRLDAARDWTEEP